MLAALDSYATTTDSYSLPINGQASEESFILNAIQNKTEYRQEVIQKTCSRTVLVGQDKSCGVVVIPICTSTYGKRKECKERLDVQCTETPIYRQEQYSCNDTISIPYEVFSHNSKAIVNVKLPAIPEGSPLPLENCSIDLKLTGGTFSSVADCNRYIVMAKKSASQSRDGQTVTQEQKLDITLLNLRDVIAPILGGIEDMRMEGQNLVFRTGDLTKNTNFALKLLVKKSKILADKVLIERHLAPSEYTFEKINDESGIVRINLEKLVSGINLKKKHLVLVDIQILTDIQNSINRNLPFFNRSKAIYIND